MVITQRKLFSNFDVARRRAEQFVGGLTDRHAMEYRVETTPLTREQGGMPLFALDTFLVPEGEIETECDDGRLQVESWRESRRAVVVQATTGDDRLVYRWDRNGHSDWVVLG